MNILFSINEDIFDFKDSGNHQIFQEVIIEFLNDLSKKILNHKESKSYPDLINFAFFIRRGNILREKSNYSLAELTSRRGIGTALLVAPSNVPMNFAFSLITTLLAGNNNIVRISQKNFDQVSLFIRLLNEYKNEGKFLDVLQRIKILNYPRESNLTFELSKNVDIRLIWGGNETVEFFKSIRTPVRCTDLYFPNRYSCCIFNVNNMVKYTTEELQSVFKNFYNDTYLSDQNACTSPKSVFWHGDVELTKNFSRFFWSEFSKYIRSFYRITDHQVLEKFYNCSAVAVNHLDQFKETKYCENLTVMSSESSIPKNLDNNICNSGLFLEFYIQDFLTISDSSNRTFQTLIHKGFSIEELNSMHELFRGKGYDRFVPLGKSQDFSFRWDGIDLIRHQSRYLELITR